MIETVPDILSRIVASKRAELARITAMPADLERRAENALAARRNFRAALEAKTPAIIAEMKKASPSKGVLSADFDPARIAAIYQRGGAAALSVLTDEKFFQGSLADLESARGASALPVLRKDFTLETIHVLEAAAHGADAILLIAAILDERRIRELRQAASRWDMAAIVEVHDDRDLDKAISAEADIVGVNNRNLATFEVTLDTSLRLADRIPAGVLRVSESGIHSPADIRMLRNAGYTAFLVGGHLMQAPQPDEALRALAGSA